MPFLDRDLLHGLLGFLGQGLEGVYVNYFSECAISINSLESEVVGGDPLRVGKIAHQMLGVSSTLGMLRLADAFQTVGETAAQQQLPRQEWIVETRRLLVLSTEAIHEVDFGQPREGC